MFIGRLVGAAGRARAGAGCWAEAWPTLLGMAAVLLVGRPVAILLQNLITQQGINANVTSHDPLAEPLARRPPGLDLLPEGFRRAHRQPGDADRPGAARERGAGRSTPSGTSWSTAPRALLLLARPTGGWRCRSLVWFVLLCRLLRVLRAADARPLARGRREKRALLTGRIVDSYTNILTVKLFARAGDEDAFVARGRARA